MWIFLWPLPHIYPFFFLHLSILQKDFARTLILWKVGFLVLLLLLFKNIYILMHKKTRTCKGQEGIFSLSFTIKISFSYTRISRTRGKWISYWRVLHSTTHQLKSAKCPKCGQYKRFFCIAFFTVCPEHDSYCSRSSIGQTVNFFNATAFFFFLSSLTALSPIHIVLNKA